MESCRVVGSLRAAEPMHFGTGPSLRTPHPASQCETLLSMRSPQPLAPGEAAAASGRDPRAPATNAVASTTCPCECVAFRYVPPQVRRSAKPGHVYCPTKTPFDDRSIYRLTYLPICSPPKTQRVPCEDCLRPPCAPISTETTSRFDFPYWGCVERLKSCKPCHRRTLGQGCISDVTTFRDDFRPPACCVAPTKVFPVSALTIPDVPMETMSLSRSSYTAPCCIAPRAAYKRMVCCQSAPFQDITVHRSDYVPWPVCRPQAPTWANKTSFLAENKPMEGVSMYGSSYLPPGSFLRVPCSDLCYEEKEEAYDPCRWLGDKPGRLPTGPLPVREHTGLCTVQPVC